LVPPKEEGADPSFEMNFNPAYNRNSLEQRGLSYKDLLLKFSDLKSPIKNDQTTFMGTIFENPPPSSSGEFKNIIMEKLFDITKNEEFKGDTV